MTIWYAVSKATTMGRDCNAILGIQLSYDANLVSDLGDMLPRHHPNLQSPRVLAHKIPASILGVPRVTLNNYPSSSDLQLEARHSLPILGNYDNSQARSF